MIIFTISDKCLISWWEIISVDEDTHIMKQGFNCWLMMVHTDQGDISSNHSNKVCNVKSYILLVWLIWPTTCGPNCNESFVAWLQGCLPRQTFLTSLLIEALVALPDWGHGHYQQSTYHIRWVPMKLTKWRSMWLSSWSEAYYYPVSHLMGPMYALNKNSGSDTICLVKMFYLML